MGSRIMSTKSPTRKKRGFTLVEIMVATGLFGIVATAACYLYFYSTRSFAAMATYADLDKINRTAMDTLTKEIRQARLVTNFSTNSLSLINGDGVAVTYWFNQDAKQFVRAAGDGSTKVL